MFKDKNINVDYVDEPHGPIYTFFLTFGGHFLNLMSANIIYVILNLPGMALAFLFSLLLLPQVSSVFIPDNFVEYMSQFGIVGNAVMNDVGADAVYQLYYIMLFFITTFLVGIGVFAIGPFQAGFEHLYRNIYRKNIVYLISDIKEGIVKNIKQSSIAMLISYLFTIVILYAAAFYKNNFGNVGLAVSVFFCVVFVVFTFIQNMVYQMIVSVDLPLKKIYKNAVIFFFMRPGKSLGLILVAYVLLLIIPYILFLSTMYIAYAVAFFTIFTIVISFVQFMFAYYTGGLINEFILVNSDETSNEETQGDS
ncbi:MAG: hypothetical protein MJ172_08520 [Clostridia bacterium]|nr:hypothetical protein [Clostridia bacterium]